MSLVVRRKVVYISVVLCVVGVVLVLGILLTESYTTREPFRVDGSWILVSDSFTLSPNNNRTYTRDTTGTNSSIIQIDINSTDALIFKIVRDGLLGYRVDFERRIGGGSGEVRYFWTPPFPSLWLFAFENPYETSASVSVKITEYYMKSVEYRDVMHYRSLLDPSFAYAGIIAVVMGTGLSLACSLIGSGGSGKKPKGRQFTSISIPLCVLGIVLVLESIVMVSYVTLEPFWVDKSKVLLNESFTLHGNTNRTYVLDSLVKNNSILEIHIEVVGFKIIDQANGRVEFSGGRAGEVFWTPSINSEWLFVHYNPFSTPRNVSVKVTEYYFKEVEYRDVTHYHPLLDPYYGYIGLAAITIATVINLTPTILESWQEYQKQLEKETIKRHQSNAR